MLVDSIRPWERPVSRVISIAAWCRMMRRCSSTKAGIRLEVSDGLCKRSGRYPIGEH